MNKQKEILKLLYLNEKGLFEITRPHFKGLFKLDENLYIKKLINNVWESSQFQLCDLFNGAIEIKPVEQMG